MAELSEEETLSVHHGLSSNCGRELEKAGEQAALEALSRMINNRKLSDLVIVCKNGVRKYGSRLWLSARCAELENLIMNATITESGRAVISLPAASPAAMLVVLEYLHTGSPGAILQRLKRKILRIISADVVNAARELRLPRLENYIWMMLEAGVSRMDWASDLDDEEDIEKEMILEALFKMLKIRRYSDVVIESRDGVLIPASRVWLLARCPVLGRMFTNFTGSDGHVQRNRQNISLNVSTEVVYIVLDYLYTGSPRPYMKKLEARKRWITGMEAICAARYLDIPHLERLLWSLLMFDVSGVTSEPPDIEISVFRLSTLRNFPFEFLSGFKTKRVEHAHHVEALAMDLVRIINLGWMESECIKHLNPEEFTFFLMKTRARGRNSDATEGEIPYKLEEYLRLRSIIKWCVWKQSRMIHMQPEIAIKLVSIFFSKADLTEPLHHPHYTAREREESYRFLYRQRRRIAQAKTTRRILKEVCNIAKFEERFLPLVNLELIHPSILTNLLKPWRLISSSLIQQALQNQAFKAVHLS